MTLINDWPTSWTDGIKTNTVSDTRILEVGGGTRVNFDWINLDSTHGEGEWKRMAQDVPWPLPDNSMDRIVASHVMEHIPAGDNRITVLNEMHRVLNPEGRLLVIVPLLGDEESGRYYGTAVADPTHVSFWTRSSFEYFSRDVSATDYGIKYWDQISWDTDRIEWEGRWVASPRKFGLPVQRLAQSEENNYGT